MGDCDAENQNPDIASKMHAKQDEPLCNGTDSVIDSGDKTKAKLVVNGKMNGVTEHSLEKANSENDSSENTKNGDSGKESEHEDSDSVESVEKEPTETTNDSKDQVEPVNENNVNCSDKDSNNDSKSDRDKTSPERESDVIELDTSVNDSVQSKESGKNEAEVSKDGDANKEKISSEKNDQTKNDTSPDGEKVCDKPDADKVETSPDKDVGISDKMTEDDTKDSKSDEKVTSDATKNDKTDENKDTSDKKTDENKGTSDKIEKETDPKNKELKTALSEIKKSETKASPSGTPNSSRTSSPAPGKKTDTTPKSKPKDAKKLAKGVTPTGTILRPMASLLSDIGMDIARQQVYKDLIDIQNKKATSSQLDDKEKMQLAKLTEAYNDLKGRNSNVAVSKLLDCAKCEFKGDLVNVMAVHAEFAHVKDKSIFHCGICNYACKNGMVHVIHVESEHKRTGRYHTPHAVYLCSFCPFETNGAKNFQRHCTKCERNFQLNRNLEPTPADCDIPLRQPPNKAKPTPPPAKPTLRPAPQPARLGLTPPQVGGAVPRFGAAGQQLFPVPPGMKTPMQQQIIQVGSTWYNIVTINDQRFLTPIVGGAPPTAATSVSQAKTQTTSPAPPKPHVVPTKTPPTGKGGKHTFEICEICGGFVKDRASLRIHFYWAHKCDIAEEVFNSSLPTLKCNHCSLRFWTYQGVVRHRQLVHPNVTNQIPTKQQNERSKPMLDKKEYKCNLCTKTVIQKEFWLHILTAHGLNKEMIYNRNNCVVCGLKTSNHVLLQKHLTVVHEELVKALDEFQSHPLAKIIPPNPSVSKSAPSPKSQKPSLKKNTPNSKAKPSSKDSSQPVCHLCDMTFPSSVAFNAHCDAMHVFACSRCGKKWSSKEYLIKHFKTEHGNEKDPCPICNEKIQIGRPTTRHMLRAHMKKCSVVIPRMDKAKEDSFFKKYHEKQAALESELQSEFAQKLKEKKQQKRAAGAPLKFRSAAAIVVLDDDSESPPPKKARIIDEVINLDDSPVKAPSKRTAPQNKDDDDDDVIELESDTEESKNEISEKDETVLNVGGEKIVVQVQEYDDSDDDEDDENDDEEEKSKGDKGENVEEIVDDCEDSNSKSESTSENKNENAGDVDKGDENKENSVDNKDECVEIADAEDKESMDVDGESPDKEGDSEKVDEPMDQDNEEK